MQRRDRFELSLLALGLLGWAVVVSPLLHTVSHGHSHKHAGSLPSSTTHGDGSFEHQRALLSSPPLIRVVQQVMVASRVVEAASPSVPFVVRHRTSELPQGP